MKAPPAPEGPKLVYPPKGDRKDKKLSGGPWAGQKHTFTQLEDGTWFPSELRLTGRDGSYVGRYTLVPVKQKSRTIVKAIWEEPEQYARALRRGIFSGRWPA